EKITLVELSESESAQVTEDEETLKRAYKFSLKGGGIMTLVLIIAWPLPLFFSNFVFDIFTYGIWVGISVVWVSVASFFIICLPIIEARKGIAQVARGQKKVSETSGGDSK
ncbi:MAG: urea active transporter, partial [Nitrosopumilus sp. D6]